MTRRPPLQPVLATADRDTVNNQRAMITAIPNSNCNGLTCTITVVTSNYNNDVVDVPFTVAVL
ncbi:hypothetical protein C5F59_038765 [Streptomyces sp. QL37]|uniref:hypothetical protein n=1 Tax=Streptomyces sp. QL37 TaxID=2093747 RepID=UPI001374D5B4|nr:hypothetical protein [Streptomyces sp. QL37]